MTSPTVYALYIIYVKRCDLNGVTPLPFSRWSVTD